MKLVWMKPEISIGCGALRVDEDEDEVPVLLAFVDGRALYPDPLPLPCPFVAADGCRPSVPAPR